MHILLILLTLCLRKPDGISHLFSIAYAFAGNGCSTFEVVQGLKVFDKNLLYITKPLGKRFWTNTAALNDADEVATTILMRSARGGV